MSPLEFREATDHEVQDVLGWTHSLWGGGHAFPDYVAKTRSLLESPWGRSHYRFVLGFEDGNAVTACKRYRLAFDLNGQKVEGVGFGAVFTPEPDRGKGYAGVLIRHVMAEEKARGSALALLFSDIGVPYYQRLGFSPLKALEAEAPAGTSRSGFAPMSETESLPFVDWLTESTRGPWAMAYDEAYWSFVKARGGYEHFVYAPKGHPDGFVAVRRTKDGVWVEAAGYAPGTPIVEFWTALRDLAGELGLPRVGGWLPETAKEAGFSFRPVTDPVLMAAPLNASALPDTLTFWGIDYF